MRRLLFVAVAVTLTLLSSASEGDEHKDKWRNVLCDPQNQKMSTELSACLKMETKAVQDATTICARKAVASSKGDINAFLPHACKNRTIFDVFDDCYEEFENKDKYKKEMEAGSPEAVRCYESVMDKYHIDIDDDSDYDDYPSQDNGNSTLTAT